MSHSTPAQGPTEMRPKPLRSTLRSSGHFDPGGPCHSPDRIRSPRLHRTCTHSPQQPDDRTKAELALGAWTQVRQKNWKMVKEGMKHLPIHPRAFANSINQVNQHTGGVLYKPSWRAKTFACCEPRSVLPRGSRPLASATKSMKRRVRRI